MRDELIKAKAFEDSLNGRSLKLKDITKNLSVRSKHLGLGAEPSSMIELSHKPTWKRPVAFVQAKGKQLIESHKDPGRITVSNKVSKSSNVQGIRGKTSIENLAENFRVPFHRKPASNSNRRNFAGTSSLSRRKYADTSTCTQRYLHTCVDILSMHPCKRVDFFLTQFSDNYFNKHLTHSISNYYHIAPRCFKCMEIGHIARRCWASIGYYKSCSYSYKTSSAGYYKGPKSIWVPKNI